MPRLRGSSGLDRPSTSPVQAPRGADSIGRRWAALGAANAARPAASIVRRSVKRKARSLEDFDFNLKIPKAKVLDLATCAFISPRENICLVGQTGVGKSHIAQTIGHRACVAGHGAL